MNKPRFFEFFAGGGMARAGLGDGWDCAFANDFDPMKAGVYCANWGTADFHFGDVNAVVADDLPGIADLAWASFPCQDLSLAGNAAGIGNDHEKPTRSGAFWAFWRLMQDLHDDNRAPSIIVLENVYGALTSNGGRDFAAIGRCLALGGYRFGAMLIDGVHFVPQSRPRIFIVAVRWDMPIPAALLADEAKIGWHPPAMSSAIGRLAEVDRDNWLWFNPPPPKVERRTLAEMIEDVPADVEWHSAAETSRLLSMMSEHNHVKLRKMQASGKRVVGTIYKRTRPDETGVRRQRAELRDDQIAGCLRTPGGGSSRQVIVVVEGDSVRSRLLSGREAARLMGLPDSYRLPPRYNDAYHVAGDGLVVPAVRYLAATVIEPILGANATGERRMAAE